MEKHDRKDGHITVFLSLILVCICSLVCLLVETARTAGARCYLQVAASSALDSVMSQYHRELWNQYRLLLLEYDSEPRVEKEFSYYLDSYFEAENWYAMKTDTITADQFLHITDDSGIYLEKEILDYMKYGIWDRLDIQPDMAERLWSLLKEGQSINELSVSYEKHTKEIFELEKTLQAIEAELSNQKSYLNQAIQMLDKYDGSGFRKIAKKLQSSLKKMPDLVKDYENKADILAAGIKETKKEVIDKSGFLSETNLYILNQELSQYDTYTDLNGKRRKEIMLLTAAANQNYQLLEELITAALDVEAAIDEWVPADEFDELDEASYWAPVKEKLNQYVLSQLTFSPGVKDEEKKGWLDNLKQMSEHSLLSLVLPENVKVSEGIFDMEAFPSKSHIETETDRFNLLNRVLVNEYCLDKFDTFRSEMQKEVQYEVEYLLGGFAGDKENLEYVVKKLLGIRGAFNLVHVLSDPAKREEAIALATLIAGASAMAPLVAVTAFFIMGIWALGESLLDIRTLLKGEKVPLLKDNGSWKLSLEGLLDVGKTGKFPEAGISENGFSYEGYLKLFLLMENSGRKYYRMMDVIQANLKRKQPDFLMEDCAYSVHIIAKVCEKHVFSNLGFVDKSGKLSSSYEMMIQLNKAY